MVSGLRPCESTLCTILGQRTFHGFLNRAILMVMVSLALELSYCGYDIQAVLLADVNVAQSRKYVSGAYGPHRLCH